MLERDQTQCDRVSWAVWSRGHCNELHLNTARCRVLHLGTKTVGRPCRTRDSRDAEEDLEMMGTDQEPRALQSLGESLDIWAREYRAGAGRCGELCVHRHEPSTRPASCSGVHSSRRKEPDGRVSASVS